MVGDILKAVVDRLNASRGVDPLKAPGDPGYIAPIPSFVGEMYINQNDIPPRIVWVPSTDTFGAPARIGESQRQLKSRAAGLDCAIWGPIEQPNPPDPLADYAGTEELLRQVIVALHQELRTRFGQGEFVELNGAEWLQPGQVTNLGMVCLLRLSLKVPISVDPPSTVRVDTLTLTTSIG